jgi:hypothetical protein
LNERRWLFALHAEEHGVDRLPCKHHARVGKGSVVHDLRAGCDPPDQLWKPACIDRILLDQEDLERLRFFPRRRDHGGSSEAACRAMSETFQESG